MPLTPIGRTIRSLRMCRTSDGKTLVELGEADSRMEVYTTEQAHTFAWIIACSALPRSGGGGLYLTGQGTCARGRHLACGGGGGGLVFKRAPRKPATH
jgi:hypothetical protein